MPSTERQLTALLDELEDALAAAEDDRAVFHVRQAMQHGVLLRDEVTHERGRGTGDRR